MAVTGHYVAGRIRSSAIPYVKTYGECVLRDVVPVLTGLSYRASHFDSPQEAQDAGGVYFGTIYAIRQSTLNLFAVGLFHLVEQQLADLCGDDCFEVKPPGDTRVSDVAKWYLKHFGLKFESLPDWATIDELRLVANAVKHADGSAADQLRHVRPELLEAPGLRGMFPAGFGVDSSIRLPLAGHDLYVSEEVFRGYSEAANSFFESIALYFEQHGDEYYPN